ncbi:uncharacterized protein LOC135323857 [Dromaius novaehollandiae]|uniref:uncharacterized protein LOC135323857 n=1 Tax=Dromaius novaehollandiae TaxID=8790 RepID=UPI00311F5839
MSNGTQAWRVELETMEIVQWDQGQSLAFLYQEQQKEAQAEWAAWEACFAGQAQELAQLASEESLSPKEESSRLVGPAVLAAIDGKSSVPVSRGHVELGSEKTRVPHPPAEPRRKETKRRWRTAVNPPPVDEESAAAMLQQIQADHLSPRGVQVLKGLEAFRTRQETFKYAAERKRAQQEEQKQLPCTRRGCWYGSGGEGPTKSAVHKAAGHHGQGRRKVLSCCYGAVWP